jgi:hypothetical protein
MPAEFRSREISGQSLTPFLTPAFGLTMINHLSGGMGGVFVMGLFQIESGAI